MRADHRAGRLSSTGAWRAGEVRPTLLPVRVFVLALSSALLLSLPSVAFAQATQQEEEEEIPAAVAADDADEAVEGDEAEQADETATQEGGYEPDQRGFDGEGGDEGGEGGGGGYEPDQRGAVDSAPVSESMEMSGGGYGGGRFFGFDVSLFLGAGLSGLDAAGGDNLVLSTQQGAVGASFGVGLGLRFGPVSLGPRFAFIVDPSFVLGTFGVDVTVALLEERVTPTVRASIAYATLLSLSDALPSQSDARVSGISAELAVGVRWTFASPFVVGAELAGTWMHLGRDAVPSCTTGCDAGAFDLRRGGESDALGLRLHVFGGISF